ncbi:DUF3365 domain-containing protein [Maribellus sp. CM-23]|uniref:Tll0287-like domain-containing protein n=1 Tax=Maribellus sp. CM-23 TaxID=2781026 RepID=UPI001F3C444E|nr:DUF3365 domain-containing protein [Maribellus sp. CM-23]MCE4565319.1 DUF3365 domain-containing protein [Maribellus sp. CM-23]
MKTILFAGILLLIGLVACQTKPGISPEFYHKFQKEGDAITSQVQGVLLSNVAGAIQKGGTEHAVEFCNVKATSLVDSLSQAFSCNISRVSDKNRNPENALNKTEAELWKLFAKNTQADTLLEINNKITYYKRINTAMPACLKCHGDPANDINGATLEKIQTLYPQDLATGYKLNDFRGLWKVVFTD